MGCPGFSLIHKTQVRIIPKKTSHFLSVKKMPKVHAVTQTLLSSEKRSSIIFQYHKVTRHYRQVFLIWTSLWSKIKAETHHCFCQKNLASNQKILTYPLPSVPHPISIKVLRTQIFTLKLPLKMILCCTRLLDHWVYSFNLATTQDAYRASSLELGLKGRREMFRTEIEY